MPINPNIALQLEHPKFDTAADLYGKRLSIEHQQQQRQLGAQQLQENAVDIEKKRRDAAAEQKWTDSWKQAGGNLKRAREIAVANGVDPKFIMKLDSDMAEQAQKLATLHTGELANHKTSNGFLYEALSSVDAIKDPAQQAAAWDAQSQRLLKGGVIKPEDVQPYPGADGVREQLSTVVTRKDLYDAADAQQKKATADRAAEEEKRKVSLHGPALASAQSGAQSAASKATQEGLVTDAMLHPGDQEAQELALTSEKRLEIAHRERTYQQGIKQFEENVRHNKAGEAETKRYHNLSVEGVTLTDGAKLKMAEMFATTGVLPAFGMGKAAAANRSEVINLAAAKFPNVDFASNKASFQANSSSLKSLTTQKDAVEAFEKTAIANLDRFLATAKNVLDTGSPLLNAPLRQISDKLLGSENMAGFRAARQVAMTEVAKVLSGALGNGVLSDSARKEVQELSGPDATLKQLYRAAEILKADMHSRKQSYDEQIGAINGRLGTGAATGAAGGAVEKWDFDANGKLVKK